MSTIAPTVPTPHRGQRRSRTLRDDASVRAWSLDAYIARFGAAALRPTGPDPKHVCDCDCFAEPAHVCAYHRSRGW